MYLLSVQQDQAVVEASLGGRIDALEMRAFGEELAELLENLATESFYVLIDYSKAKSLDSEAINILSWIKDSCLDNGAKKIVSIPRDETDLVTHTTARLQYVLEGREEFSLEPEAVSFPAWTSASISLAA